MILSTIVTSQLHFEICAGLYAHPVFFLIKIFTNIYWVDIAVRTTRGKTSCQSA